MKAAGLGMRMGPWLFAVIASVCALVMFASSVVIVRTVGQSARVDISDFRGTKLSMATRRVLSGLREPVRLTLYRSVRGLEDRPDLRAFGERAAALLQAYEAAAPSRILLEEREPARFSRAEDDAIRAGLKPLAESWSVQPIYLGVVARNALDEQRSWPQLTPEQEGRLEQILTGMIHDLEDPGAPMPAAPLRPLLQSRAAAADLERLALQRELAAAEGAWLSAGPDDAAAAQARMLALRETLRRADEAQARRKPAPPLWAALGAVLGAPMLLLGFAAMRAVRRARQRSGG